MLYREIVAVCSEIHIEHANTLCGQSVVFYYVNPGGTWSNDWDFMWLRSVGLKNM